MTLDQLQRDASPSGRRGSPRGGRAIRLLRYTGWTLITAGVVVLLYVVYSLFFTNLATGAAQSDLSAEWESHLRQATSEPDETPDETPDEDAGDDPAPVVDPGAAYAVLEFARPGAVDPLVHADPLFVVSGVSREDLMRGPGHYPDTAVPGAPGNLAIAGHRTTYGSPFYHLDQLVEGDQVLVTGRDGQRHTYRVVRQEIVSPRDVWVVDEDPLGSGVPTLTLTTCHPRFSAAQRLVVFAELVDG